MRDMHGVCEGSMNLLDDIFVGASLDAVHDRKLEALLHRLSERRARINLANAEKGLEELHFLGFRVRKDALLPLDSTVGTLRGTSIFI